MSEKSELLKLMVAASDELDAKGLSKYAAVVDDVINKLAQETFDSLEIIESEKKEPIKNLRVKAQRKVQEALNLASKATHGKFYHDEHWQGVREFENVVVANVDSFYGAVHTEYITSRARGEMDLKLYTFRVEQDGFKFDFDLSASEEGTRGGYQVWYTNLRRAKEE